MENKFPKKDFGGAIFLLFLGTIFLLNTTGVVDWGIWLHILKFWPVFLILWGIRLVFEGTKITEIIMTIATLLSYLLVGLLAYSSYTNQQDTFLKYFVITPRTNDTEFNTEETLSVLKDTYKDVEKRILDIDIAASKATISDDRETNYLEVDGNYNKMYVEPSVQSKLTDGELTILFDTVFPKNRMYWGQSNMDFNLYVGQPTVLTDIILKLGAGDTTLTFDKLLLDNIAAKIGAGRLALDLSDLSIPKNIDIEVGAGEMILTIPKGIGYEIDYVLGLGEIKVDGDQVAVFAGEGTSYKSSNYDKTTQKLTIDAKVGVGAFSIVTK